MRLVLEEERDEQNFVHAVLMGLQAADDDPYGLSGVEWDSNNDRNPVPFHHPIVRKRPDGQLGKWQVCWTKPRACRLERVVLPTLEFYGVCSVASKKSRRLRFWRRSDVLPRVLAIPSRLCHDASSSMVAGIVLAARFTLAKGRRLMWYLREEALIDLTHVPLEFVDVAQTAARYWWDTETCAVLAWKSIDQFVAMARKDGESDDTIGYTLQGLVRSTINLELLAHGLVCDYPAGGLHFVVKTLG